MLSIYDYNYCCGLRIHVQNFANTNTAERHIPADRHSETVLYMLATAGMRVLPEISQAAILAEIRRRTPLLTNFHFADNHVNVISGKEEGMYAWISANYVLNRLRIGENGKREESVGIIDMGGGSIQIAFEVDQQEIGFITL